MLQRFLDPATLASISSLDLVAKTVVDGFVAGLHRSPDFGFSQEFAEYRAYAEGDDLLFNRGVFVIPDILANGGGVTVSYFEWVQDRQGYFWPEDTVNERLKQIMVAAFNDVVKFGEKHNVNNRIAAYMLAIDRVAYTLKLRGI